MQTFNDKLEGWDEKLVNWARRVGVPFAKFALFFVYFYFGFIKVFFENGAANPMVTMLLAKTMPFFAPGPFLVVFGVFEMVIGLVFIIPRLERLGIFLLALHMITTILPLFLLPQYTWVSFFVPTIEGQYIMKNILIISLAVVILAGLRTLKEDKHA